jgi:hypothetical protein
MFDRDELADAVDLQGRSYRLILWVSGAVERGFIPFGRAHEYSTAAEAAEEWLVRHYESFPLDARPLDRSGPELRRYANFFISYLQASFELDAVPTVRMVPWTACFCPFCRDFAIVVVSHLRTKKLRPKDKQRARELKENYLVSLAADNHVDTDTEKIDGLLTNPELSIDAALATYGEQLLARCRGVRSSPAVLALWREFAWTRAGSPNHKFRLRAQDIIKAEQKLTAALAD